MRVPCKKGDKYLYHGYSDNIYGVSFLDSEFPYHSANQRSKK